MSLFNDLSGEGSPAEKVTAVLVMFLGKVFTLERVAPRKCQCGGVALGSGQVLSDLVSSPSLPARIPPYRPSQAAPRPCSLSWSETPNSLGRRGGLSRQDGHPTSSGDSQARSLAVSEPDGPCQREGSRPLLGPPRRSPARHGPSPQPPPLRNTTLLTRESPFLRSTPVELPAHSKVRATATPFGHPGPRCHRPAPDLCPRRWRALVTPGSVPCGPPCRYRSRAPGPH